VSQTRADVQPSGNEVKTVRNPTFYYLVKPGEAKQHIFLCEAKS